MLNTRSGPTSLPQYLQASNAQKLQVMHLGGPTTELCLGHSQAQRMNEWIHSLSSNSLHTGLLASIASGVARAPLLRHASQ